MSSGELLLIFLVALIVFGPNKLPMLAEHLGKFFRVLNSFKQHAEFLWQKQIDEQNLCENKRKAEKADAIYQIEHKENTPGS